MNIVQGILAILATGAGALLQGMTGLGLNLFAAPLLTLIDPRFVPAPIMLSALVLTVLMVLRDRSGIDLHGVGWMAAGMVPGSVLGSILLPVLPHKTLALVLGGLVLAGVVLSLSGLRFPPWRSVLFAAGFLSGLGGTLASIGAPPVALVNQEMEPKRLRSTLSGYFILSGIAAVIGAAAAGRLGATEFHLAGWMLPGIFLGFLLSYPLIGLVSPKISRVAVLGLSAVAALLLIAQTILQ